MQSNSCVKDATYALLFDHSLVVMQAQSHIFQFWKDVMFTCSRTILLCNFHKTRSRLYLMILLILNAHANINTNMILTESFCFVHI